MNARKLFFNPELTLEVEELVNEFKSSGESQNNVTVEFPEDRFEVNFGIDNDGSVVFESVEYWNEEGDVETLVDGELDKLGELFSLDLKGAQ